MLQASDSDQPTITVNAAGVAHATEIGSLPTSQQQACVQHLAVLCDALGVMQRLGDAVDTLRQRMQAGLWRICQHCLAVCSTTGNGTANTTDSECIVVCKHL
jgi:hypothetical protein